MIRDIAIGRRQFCGIAGFTLIGASAGGLGSLGIARHASAHQLTVSQRLLAKLQLSEFANEVGKAYLQLRPQEADVRFLAASLVGDKAINNSKRILIDESLLQRAFLGQCRRDFERGELISIGGWFLARSEARACALVRML